LFYLRFDNANAQLSTFIQFLHPDYSASNTNNDVCLLKLDTPLNFTSGRVAPISLNQNDDWNDASFTVTGWGTTSVIFSPTGYLLIVCSTLQGFEFWSVANYESLGGHGKNIYQME
jgi:hypothetical protein